jgi:hypothetical protein
MTAIPVSETYSHQEPYILYRGRTGRMIQHIVPETIPAKRWIWSEAKALTVALLFLCSEGPGIAAPTAHHTFIKLSDDYLNMSEVRAADGSSSRLIVFVQDSDSATKRLRAETLVRQGDSLAVAAPVALPDDVSAFDVCPQSGPKKSEFIVLLRPGGLYKLGESQPFIEAPTLFAYRQEHALPRIRVCFPLFQGEPHAYLVPQLSGRKIFRQKEPNKFVLAGDMTTAADLRYQSALLRGDDLEKTQRIVFRLEMSDMHIVDYNNDGLMDLCFTVKDSLKCRLQDRSAGFSQQGAKEIQYQAHILTQEEELDTNIRVDSKLVDISGDRKPDLIVNKVNWNLANLGTKISFYKQNTDGTLAKDVSDTIERRGYFSYQEYMDFDGDGLMDIVAPYAGIDWRELAQIYLTRNVDIDFVWYKNLGGRFDEKSQTIHSLSYPVEFKNLPAILGALPQWNVRLRAQGNSSKSREILVFPKKKAIELRSIVWESAKSGKADTLLWRLEAPLGSDVLLTDLDKDGVQEVIFAYPRDPQRKNQILFIHATGDAPH